MMDFAVVTYGTMHIPNFIFFRPVILYFEVRICEEVEFG